MAAPEGSPAIATAAGVTRASPAIGKTPSSRQSAAATNIGTRIEAPGSWACSAMFVRGSPRKTTP